MLENRKAFDEPEFEIIKLLVADVITSSADPGEGEGGGSTGDDWNAGEF